MKKVPSSIIIAVFILVAAAFLINRQKTVGPNNNTTTTTNNIAPTPILKVVMVTSNGFDPQTITIQRNETIKWVNTTGGKVTVNSDNYPTNKLYPFLNLGEFDTGSSVDAVFENVGSYKYHNQFKPTQTGTVVVK